MNSMDKSNKHDAWNDGASYESYMGRWSRKIAVEFLRWLDMSARLDWLEVGCGSGALTSTILTRTSPNTVHAIDPSEGFVEATNRSISDARLSVAVGKGDDLRFSDASMDIVVSGLVLNFIDNKEEALAEMVRVAKPSGKIAFYVWDYPGAGVEFMRYFWKAAVECDPEAEKYTEGQRFSYCNERDLLAIAGDAGLLRLKSTALEVASIFTSFDDYWQPFTLGVGPAPGYCAKLPEAQREKIRESLRSQLPIMEDGSIHLKLKAWAISGDVAD
jgi:ubiquinone/menaquinone biosynthesis C-methylase UbiE